MGEIVLKTNSTPSVPAATYGSIWIDSNGLLNTINPSGSSIVLSMISGSPATAGATGTFGQVRISGSTLYVCIAANTWVRSAFSTW
jgi:hypothetical protein